jgi:predicted O-linked N-acetylglucosamine transferase (SPINDLY family)
MSTLPSLNAIREMHRAGRLAEAEAGYRSLLASDPGNADALHLLGVLACQRGEPHRALALFSEAIARDDRQAAYHTNLAVALTALGRGDEAVLTLQRAKELAPDDPNISYNLGAALQAMDRHAAAIPHYEQALAAAPGYVDALSNLGLALVETDRAEQALAPLHRAVELSPENPSPLVNLGMALAAIGAPKAGETYLRRACQKMPDSANAYYNLGKVLQDQGRNAEAVEIYDRAAALNPRDASTPYNAGNALRELGRVDDALAAYGRALSCDPQHVKAWRNRLSTLLYTQTVSLAEQFALHLRFSAAFDASRGSQPPRPKADPRRPLRIGYLSSDLRHHPVSRNLEPVLAHRDHTRYSIFCYADVRKPDSATEGMRRLVDGWHSIVGLGDDEVAALIRADEIDILVLLAGRFDDNRPLVALRRPAPIQISLHDPATSGLAEIDYLIADRHLAPRHMSDRFVERLLRLPSFYVHGPLDPSPEPIRRDDPNARAPTFASYCNPAKLSPELLSLWGRILQRLPHARLQLSHRRRFAEPALQEHVRAALVSAGAASGQVDFLGSDATRAEHLERYQNVDVALDPLPFAGSTSTFEALWMGVPVVTFDGETMVGRWSAAILRTLGLDELVARTADAYVDIAVALANNPAKRAELRRGLRARLVASPLCDGPRRARQIERLYRAVWRRWCASQPSPDLRIGASAT